MTRLCTNITRLREYNRKPNLLPNIMTNIVFFGENGLTSTSANHVANIAKEYVQDIESRLANVRLYKTEVALIGTETRNLLSDGWCDANLEDVKGSLELIIQAKSLIAWLREAIKARSQKLSEAEGMTIEEWAERLGIEIELPTKPVRRASITKEDVIDAMNVKERNRIFALETKCATIGKYIHLDGNFAKARKELLKKLSEQNKISGEGRDALLYHYTPTCNPDNVEKVFFALQDAHRETQAELNRILHDIDEKVRDENQKAESDYCQALSEYQIEMEKLQSQFKIDKAENLKRIAALKIVIPNDLKEIYDVVNKLGK